MNILETMLEGLYVYLTTKEAIEFYERLGYKKQLIALSKVVGQWPGNHL